ncbi:MAG: polysaccharide pyruvyl transferase family protein [Candidatus Cloacimonetes bacterium]|nr:polysaccharide pyruvyl transferase family protein [Candidatus Cloacimonadota bacterium]
MIISDRIQLMRFAMSHWKTISGLNKRAIGYIGWVGHKNLGDEAMLIAFKSLFKAHTIFPYSKIKSYPRMESKLRPKELSAIVLGGGTLINSQGSFDIFKNTFKNYTNGIKFSFGSGVKNPVFWKNVKGWSNTISEWAQYLKKCEYVSVRGPLSKEILNDAGLDKVELIGDIALTLAGENMMKKQKRKSVAINIGACSGRLWGTEELLLQKMTELIYKLIEKDWNITLFSVWDKDVDLINILIEKVGKPIPKFEGFRSIAKTLKFLEKCDVVIGMKLHSVILAHCAYTPAIMLEYRPKCLDYMLSMNLDKYNVKTDQIEPNHVMSLLNEIYQTSEQYQFFLSGKIKYYKNLQKQAAINLNKLI